MLSDAGHHFWSTLLRSVTDRKERAMKSTAVSSKQLRNGCWLAKRFAGGCGRCEYLGRCEMPEAKRARAEKAKEGQA